MHEGQLRAWDSTARFTFVVAGTQSGKTSFGPWWLRRAIQRHGPGDYLAVTSTYDLFKLKLLPEMMRVFVHYLGAEGWQYRAGERTMERSDTRIILRSAEAEGGLESATAKAALLDECGQDAFRLEAWEAVLRRLSLHQGPVFGGTTPYNLGWLKREVYDRWRAGDTDYNVIQFKSTMNPRFPVEEYLRAKATMADWKFRMFYDGEFTRPAGLIYSDFDDQLNIVKPFDIPPTWPRFVGVDFGGVNVAKLWVAQEPLTHQCYLYREQLDGNKTTKEHCNELRAKALFERVVAYVGGAKSEDQQRRDWGAEGVQVLEPKVSDVEAGIDRVTALIKTRMLKVFSTCTGFLDEIGTYSRELDARGEPTEKIAGKNSFHRLDAMRYVASLLMVEPLGPIITAGQRRWADRTY